MNMNEKLLTSLVNANLNMVADFITEIKPMYQQIDLNGDKLVEILERVEVQIEEIRVNLKKQDFEEVSELLDCLGDDEGDEITEYFDEDDDEGYMLMETLKNVGSKMLDIRFEKVLRD